MALFVALFIAPLAYALYLSLFREQLVGGNSFVGLDNYADGLKDNAVHRRRRARRRCSWSCRCPSC